MLKSTCLLKIKKCCFQKVQSTESVGAIAVDRDGHLAVGLSTGGILGKLPGRVGDSPQIGKGAYCDDDLGAVSVTGRTQNIAFFSEGFIWQKQMFKIGSSFANINFMFIYCRSRRIYIKILLVYAHFEGNTMRKKRQ